ncbi:hypothetical protein KFK09_026328 [Dendrobium nobile]|uniref:Uncharacterized protein n=1 Tax=Dendrobium nobile TaxID=94219 RepID=A0A8T3A7I1_DENNO|nr:hypothetical protein KFK09_026328 [Dendrobium nobile]
MSLASVHCQLSFVASVRVRRAVLSFFSCNDSFSRSDGEIDWDIIIRIIWMVEVEMHWACCVIEKSSANLSSEFALRSYLYLLFHMLVAGPTSWFYKDKKVSTKYILYVVFTLSSALFLLEKYASAVSVFTEESFMVKVIIILLFSYSFLFLLHDIMHAPYLWNLISEDLTLLGKDLSKWETLAAVHYLDRELSPAIYRSFLIPYSWHHKMSWIITLLRKIPQTMWIKTSFTTSKLLSLKNSLKMDLKWVLLIILTPTLLFL